MNLITLHLFTHFIIAKYYKNALWGLNTKPVEVIHVFLFIMFVQNVLFNNSKKLLNGLKYTQLSHSI